MNEFILFNVNFIVLVLLYKFLLAKSGVPLWNRWVLLSLPVAAFALSLLQLLPEAAYRVYQVQLPSVIIEQQSGLNGAAGTFSPLKWLYISGVLLFGALHLWGGAQLYRRIKKASLLKKIGSISVYKSTINASFGRTIFIKEDIDQSEMDIIIKHELAHSNQRHTLDKIFGLLIQLVIWFNPIVYVWQNLIDKNHEYLADEEVLESEELENYAQFLLQQTMRSNINFSLIPISKMSHLKSRIMKMKSKSINQYTMKKSKVKYLWLPACLLVLSVGTISANYTVDESHSVITEKRTPIEDPDVMPQFKGGTEAMMEFLVNNIKYPETAKKQNIEGVVYTAFVVKVNGEVTNVHLKRGVESSLDSEAMRVIRAMPKWIPGEKDGKKVGVEIVVPIKFQIALEEK